MRELQVKKTKSAKRKITNRPLRFTTRNYVSWYNNMEITGKDWVYKENHQLSLRFTVMSRLQVKTWVYNENHQLPLAFTTEATPAGIFFHEFFIYSFTDITYRVYKLLQQPPHPALLYPIISLTFTHPISTLLTSLPPPPSPHTTKQTNKEKKRTR